MSNNASTNRAILTIYRKIDNPRHTNPVSYNGVIELMDRGFVHVEVVLPMGVKPFPYVPYMVTVSCEDTFAEYRKGAIPLLTVNQWEEMEHYYC